MGDVGYWHTRQIEAIAERGIEVLVPPDGAARDGKRPGTAWAGTHCNRHRGVPRNTYPCEQSRSFRVWPECCRASIWKENTLLVIAPARPRERQRCLLARRQWSRDRQAR